MHVLVITGTLVRLQGLLETASYWQQLTEKCGFLGE
jgi:hypothetical protein